MRQCRALPEVRCDVENGKRENTGRIERSRTWSSSPSGSIGARWYASKLVLVGNLDVSYLLVRGTKEEVEDAVRKAIKDAARGGGYILAQSHSHSLVDPMRLKWMIDAAHKYGKYPISL